MEVNQWLKPRKGRTISNLVDMGWCAARGPMFGSTPGPVDDKGEEAMLKVCGVGMARLSGYSWAPNWLIGYLVNVGTIHGCPFPGDPLCGGG